MFPYSMSLTHWTENLTCLLFLSVFAAGNDYTYGGDVNFDGIINNRYTVSVGATGKNGLRK